MSVRSLWRWPVPALTAWLLAWAGYAALALGGAAPAVALAGGTVIGGLFALTVGTRWRRLIVAAGFPLSLAASGAALPGWAWLLPLALLVLLYPLRSWHDAPLFPTPRGALDGLAAAAPLPNGARVLDAGCGVGDGLLALRDAYPHAAITGIEWSRPLAMLARLRCRFADVRRGDLWAADWSGFDLVYLFQRPESMPRAAAKAARELRPGAWLVSLEFAVPGWRAAAQLQAVPGKPVWVYRMPPPATR
ncbi:class I SAM-dependent methyltransferase [Calidifontimicrobium sp. SYSU G02091]|uniref:class I SAM-dependent methyltransferase n=1 Tax=Calidifontimicrobium sp. SYSU G02091 TaxID=2926421 RepID=UPI001F53AE44|nr:class I SAM-dependent methyltransferase [Calidifontimicrobium sp. SYSU G02091]